MKEVINLEGQKEMVSIDTPVKTINGVHHLLNDNDALEISVKQSEWDAGAVKRNAIAEIARLEAQITPRRIREAVLKIGNGWLANQDALIAIERTKL